MKYLKKLEEYQGNQRTVITLGKFDGLHRGHQKLIHSVIEISTESKTQGEGLESVVFAFDMLAMRKGKCATREQLMMNDERASLLDGQVDYLLECPFDENVRCMLAEDFIRNILVEQFNVKYIVVGEDFRFGYKAQGDINLLKNYASQYEYEVIAIPKEKYGEREISSTYIKEQLVKGEIQVANDMLGYRYSITGEVIHGQKLGRTLGFPTLNIPIAGDKALPPYGVYAVKVQIGKNGQCEPNGSIESNGSIEPIEPNGSIESNGSIEPIEYYGIANLGTKPTVLEDGQPLVEAHVYDYDEDAYGEKVKVSFLKLVRLEQKFASIEELKNQVNLDLEEGKLWIAEQAGVNGELSENNSLQ